MELLELHDDPETLAAALALIDEWELETLDAATNDGAADATTDASSSPSSSDTDKNKRPRDINPRQLSRREELVFLRRKVRDLEAELSALRAAHDETDLESDDGALVERQSSKQLDATWVWQQIASRQLEHRQNAEAENLKLRVKVEEQLQISKDLLRVLIRAYHLNDEARATETERRHVKRVKLPTKRMELTAVAQLQLVDALYDERDTIFLNPPFSNGPPVMREVRLHEHDNGEATINLDSSWVLPFAVDHVTSAFWMYLVRKNEPETWRFEPADRTEDDRDILTADFEFLRQADDHSGTFLGRFVARRVRAMDVGEPAYVLWHKWSNPVDFRPTSMEGVCVHNQSIMRMVSADNGDATGRLCVVQMSQRVHVGFAASESPTRRRRVGVLTNYLLENIVNELHWKQQVLENLLLQSVVPTAPTNVPTWTYKTVALTHHDKKPNEPSRFKVADV